MLKVATSRPGGIDAHVHLEEPQLFGKGSSADTFETDTRSAICGGTTTIIAFAPQQRTEDSLLSTLEATHKNAEDNCYTDYSFHLLVSNPSERALAEFPTLREKGISSLKICMTYAALQLNDGQILDILLAAREHGITTLIHAENNDLIIWITAQLEKRKMYAPRYHATSHPAMAEIEATYRAICLSEFIDVPILLVHISSPAAASHIRSAQSRGLPVYAETCPQYLFLIKADLDKPGFEGAKCVCTPPPRENERDQEGIWQGLEDGTFTVLSSDHCPFIYDDSETGKKTCTSVEYPEGQFKYIPNGCPGVETRLPLAMSADRLEMKRFVAVTATNPAKLYGLYPRKGAFLPGRSDADLVIWYPSGKLGTFALTNEMLHHNVDYTPYEGKPLTQWPRYTILRGNVMWDRDGFIRTEFLQHKRHSLLSTSRTLRIYVPRFDFSQAIKAIIYVWAREPGGAPFHGMTVVLIVDGPDLDTRSLGRWIQRPAASSLNIQYLLRLNVMSKEHQELTHTVLRGMKSSVPAPPEWQALRNALASCRMPRGAPEGYLPPELRCLIYDRVPPRTLIVPSEGRHLLVSPLTAVCGVVRAEYLHHVDKRADVLRRSRRMLCRVQNLDFAPVLALSTGFPQLDSSPTCEIDVTLIFNSTQMNGDCVAQWLEFLAARPMQLRIDYHPDWSALNHEDHMLLHSILRTVYKKVLRGNEYQ
ncbi:hypothetical protein B0A48_17915 [Cryoendolithus antarcticus]|uniref:Amidohydrolase-related domain-containing protein n=1 Tax=Cryoendolithus antarcticus TaxID=1507870 RepID=A0A1V8SA16_9PEZI|nr:hypothetical protein B0A48_17915 [Cryoendolithus antarcticus]